MALFRYICQKCSCEFKSLQSPKVCPSCGYEHVKKIITFSGGHKMYTTLSRDKNIQSYVPDSDYMKRRAKKHFYESDIDSVIQRPDVNKKMLEDSGFIDKGTGKKRRWIDEL